MQDGEKMANSVYSDSAIHCRSPCSSCFLENIYTSSCAASFPDSRHLQFPILWAIAN